jgi:hypothetical protein
VQPHVHMQRAGKGDILLTARPPARRPARPCRAPPSSLPGGGSRPTAEVGAPPSRRAAALFPPGVAVRRRHQVIGQHGDSRLHRDGEPAGPILRTFLGGGGPRSSFWRWWAWPLPPAGPMEFVCEWPALGIPETRAGLDAQLILDAAGRKIRLWSGEEGRRLSDDPGSFVKIVDCQAV